VGGFALLEHTADIGISACGDSLEESLSWLATGMFSLIVDPDTVAVNRFQFVTAVSRDRETLVVDWLNELLYQHETTGLLLKDCHVSLEQGDTRLEALCRGEQSDPGRHHILTVVKAATYHGLSVSHDRRWHVRVILDV
jgi:SHS2 domain-containing protein